MNSEDRKQIIKLTGDVGKLKGTVVQMDKNLNQNLKDLSDRVSKVISNHEDRLNVVEDDCAHSRGRTAGIAFMVSAGVSVIGLLIAFWKLLK